MFVKGRGSGKVCMVVCLIVISERKQQQLPALWDVMKYQDEVRETRDGGREGRTSRDRQSKYVARFEQRSPELIE